MELAAFLILVFQNLGWGKTYPWSVLPAWLSRGSWALAAVAVVLLIACSAYVPKPWLARFGRWSTSRAWLILLLVGNAGIALVQYRYYQRFGYSFPWMLLAVAIVGIPWVRRERFWWSCLLSLGLLAGSIVQFPLNPLRSDMLPAIHAALDALQRGASPYGYLEFGSEGHLFSYLPGTLFSHLPAWALGTDLRWGEWVYRALWMAVLNLGVRRLPPSSGWLGVAHLYVFSPYFNYRHELYFEAFLLLIVAYQAYPRARWLLIPLLVVTRQWSWVMAPFLALAWIAGAPRRDRGPAAAPAAPPWRPMALRAAALAGSTAAVLGTVALLIGSSTSWRQFLDGIFLVQSWADLPSYPGDYGLTVAPLFYAAGSAHALQPLQMLLVLAVLILVAVRWAQGRLGQGEALQRALHVYGAATLCAFVVLNIQLWNYFWLSPVLWLLAIRAMDIPAGSPAPQAAAA